MKPETQQRWRCAKIANFVEMVQKRRTARFLPKPFAHQLLVVSSPRPRWFQFSALTLVSKAQALAGVPLVGLVFGVSKKACLASWPWALIVHMYIYIYIFIYIYKHIYYIHEVFEGIHLGICTISDHSSDSPQLWLSETNLSKKGCESGGGFEDPLLRGVFGNPGPGVNPNKNRSGEDVLFGQESVELFKTDELVWFDTNDMYEYKVQHIYLHLPHLYYRFIRPRTHECLYI